MAVELGLRVGPAAVGGAAIAQLAGEGAQLVFTPEMSGLLDRNRKRAAQSIRAEADDPVLAEALMEIVNAHFAV